MSTIIYSQLGTWGRLGNSLFQIASMIGLSETYKKSLLLPKWKYSEYFEYGIQVGKLSKDTRKAQERGFDYSKDHWDSNLLYTIDDVDIMGWLQSEKYWRESVDKVRSVFTFKQDFADRTRKKMSDIFDNGKETIAVSIRRGDYVGNGNYELLPITYYALALYNKFPKWRTDYNVIIFTDDFYYAKHHFECHENVYYAEYEGIEQLYLMTQCKHFIIANSTFSWWGAYLGWKKDSKIIRPNYLFDGNLKRDNSDKDFWPEEWEIFDHKDEKGNSLKFDLQDVTFTIPIFYDHKDREENLSLNLLFLRKHFDCEIVVGEQGQPYFKDRISKGVKYHFFEDLKYFHRTKMLNDMSNMSDTPIAVNYDADMFTPPLQILEAANKIRSGEFNFVYPYDGRFARVNRQKWYRELKRELDTSIFYNNKFHGINKTDTSSTGGAVMYDKESFVYVGMENENMISYGPEDTERWERYHRLGYSVGRIKGIIYHMDHTITTNSSGNHPHHGRNFQELERVRSLNDEQLLEDVGNWKWVNKYMSSYYEAISEGSINSSREIFSLPEVVKDVKTILDIGAGVGEWGVGINEKGISYHAVDYKIPKQNLLIPKDHYKNFDLRRDKSLFPYQDPVDMILCLEVMEHIEERYAEEIIAFMCNKANKILFSAAIPCQGGHFHCNEQWQDYWAELFEKYGFYPYILTNKIKNNKKIESWYRQNIVLYLNQPTGQSVEKFVLPEMYTNIIGTRTNWKTIKSI